MAAHRYRVLEMALDRELPPDYLQTIVGPLNRHERTAPSTQAMGNGANS
jgi:hypothetical protein